MLKFLACNWTESSRIQQLRGRKKEALNIKYPCPSVINIPPHVSWVFSGNVEYVETSSMEGGKPPGACSCERSRLFHGDNNRKWASQLSVSRGSFSRAERVLKCHLLAPGAVPLGLGMAALVPSRAGCDYLNSCTWKLLFNFHCDTGIALRGLRGNGCEELDPWEREAFTPRAWAGLSGVLTEIEWRFALNVHLCISFSQPGADNRVLWLPLLPGRRMHVDRAVFNKRTLKILWIQLFISPMQDHFNFKSASIWVGLP